ncbi:hypothetical protein Tco_1403362 [Tanacetum coccineum]
MMIESQTFKSWSYFESNDGRVLLIEIDVIDVEAVGSKLKKLTPFGDSDFLLEETDAFLAIEDDLISLEVDDSYYDSEGDIRLLEEFP